MADKFSQMTLKMAMKQLAHLGCVNVTQVKKGSSSVTFEYHGHCVIGDARDLLRELSEESVSDNAKVEWF
jgi:hypothetical protein